jgi:hypothetical protein
MASWKTTSASLGAVVSSLLTLSCCLPLPFLGAAGIAGSAVFLGRARPWLAGLSVVFLAVGFWQVHRGMRCRVRQSKIAIALLSIATVIVVLLLLFPQVIASVLADITAGAK